VSQEVIDKSQRCGKSRAEYHFVGALYKQLLSTAMLVCGWYPFLWSVSGALVHAMYGRHHAVRVSQA
jgi:hypothetical protein